MHCDDKRTLFALKESIERDWEELQKSNFGEEWKLREFRDMLAEYFELKQAT